MAEKLPYEIHITIAPGDLPRLKDRVACNGTKILEFENIKSDGSFVVDAMTSTQIELCHFNNALTFLDQECRALEAIGIQPLRRKIETVPWHPLVENAIISGRQDYYFETHMKVLGFASDLSECGLLVSRNRKTRSKCATLRTHSTYDEHLKSLYRAVQRMTIDFGIAVIDKVDTEFVIFDNNRDHDKAWEGRE